MREIDQEFISRVYRTSLCLWALGIVLCLILMSWMGAVGWTLGAATSVGLLKSLEWFVPKAFAPGGVRARGQLVRFSLAKLAVIVVILSGIVILGGRSFPLILGFSAGLLLTQATIFFKVLGKLICERTNDSARVER